MSENTKSIHAHIASKIRLNRQLCGFTQEMIADQLRITHQQVQKYESGKNKISADRLWEISRIFNVPIFDFYPSTDFPIEQDQSIFGDTKIISLLRVFHIMRPEMQKAFLSIGQCMVKAFGMSIKVQKISDFQGGSEFRKLDI